MNANGIPEKIYIQPNAHDGWFECNPQSDIFIEYTRTDAFIEKVLKWYCLDCACNDNCAANHKCAFWSFFKDYLEGNDKALPPKIGNAFNPDGSTTENYRYRHIIERMQDTFIEKACKWLKESITNNPECNRIISLNGTITMGMLIEDFKNYMKGGEE